MTKRKRMTHSKVTASDNAFIPENITWYRIVGGVAVLVDQSKHEVRNPVDNHLNEK